LESLREIDRAAAQACTMRLIDQIARGAGFFRRWIPLSSAARQPFRALDKGR